MTAKPKKAKKKKGDLRASAAPKQKGRLRKAHSQTGRIARLRASAGRASAGRASEEGDLLRLVEADAEAESRWNRPRKQRISLRVDCEVVEWFKSLGPGYTTRINRVLRRVMVEGKERSEK